MTASCLYFGTIVHRRFKPRRHKLCYRVYSMLLDLDELPSLATRLFSHNRFNLFSFYDRDHGDGADRPLRAYVEALLAAAGIDLEGGAIRLWCSPRVLGYVFNPISIYFCTRRGGVLAAMLYEVNNTFGERHTYLIPAGENEGGTIRQSCEKLFYVSPFIAMAMTYHFRIAEPGEDLSIRVNETDAAGLLLTASFAGQRAPLGDRTLVRAFLAYPLLTLKIVVGIHWEALRLWLKGMRILDRPKPPVNPVTIVPVDGR